MGITVEDLVDTFADNPDRLREAIIFMKARGGSHGCIKAMKELLHVVELNL